MLCYFVVAAVVIITVVVVFDFSSTTLTRALASFFFFAHSYIFTLFLCAQTHTTEHSHTLCIFSSFFVAPFAAVFCFILFCMHNARFFCCHQ